MNALETSTPQRRRIVPRWRLTRAGNHPATRYHDWGRLAAVTMIDREMRLAALGVLAVCALLAGPAAFAQENEQQPLTLRRAITLSLQHSSEVALATARHALAEGQEALARAPFRPSLFTGSGAAYTNGFPLISGGAPSLFNVSYAQTLFNPSLRGQARAAKARTEVERLGL